MEQEEYNKEEIDWTYIDFVDNQDVLDLIEKKPGGLIALLDEACMFPKSTHETFCEKLYQIFKVHKRFIKPKLSQTGFTISHYAGEVLYQSDQFLDKNKDYVVAEHQDLLSASKCLFVSGLFPPINDETTKSSKFASIGSRFKLQLQSLMETLNSTEPHYVRCVKPNNLLKPTIFENVNVMQQLRCGGVLEAIRISCAGYPTRMRYYEFLLRFRVLAPEVTEGTYFEKEACRNILDKKGLQGYQMGKTKIFLQAGLMAELDAWRTKILSRAAKSIQCHARRHIARKQYIALRRSSIHVQSSWRGRQACKLYEGMRRDAAALKVQKNLRRYHAKKDYKSLHLSLLVLQAGLRGMVARNEFTFNRQMKATTIIKAQWRCHIDSSYYKKLKWASITMQCRWREKTARRELRKLKMAARESGALKKARKMLEKQVEELTWRLQLETHLRSDMEDVKDKEIIELQNSLQAMQNKVDEANAMLVKEREAARRVIEHASPMVKDAAIYVQVAEKIDSLTEEVEQLKRVVVAEREQTTKEFMSQLDALDMEILHLRESIEKGLSSKIISHIQGVLANYMVGREVDSSRPETQLQRSHDMELHVRIQDLKSTISQQERELKAYKSLCESFLSGESTHQSTSNHADPSSSPTGASQGIEHLSRKLSQSSVSRLVVLLPTPLSRQEKDSSNIPVSLADVLVTEINHQDLVDGDRVRVDHNIDDESSSTVTNVDGGKVHLGTSEDGGMYGH